MKKTIIKLVFLILIIIGGIYAKRKFYAPAKAGDEVEELIKNNKIKNGDLIFQTSTSKQSKAIQLATDSKYSHCGIIYCNNGKYYVFEAIHHVTKTPLDKWIARGKDGHFVIKRLRNSEEVLTSKTLQKLKLEGNKFNGKNYD